MPHDSGHGLVITAIVADPRNSDNVRISVGDERYSVEMNAVIALGLHVGKQISVDTLRKLDEAATASRAKTRALRLLAGRAYTEQQMRQRLLQADIPEASVEQVIAWLLERRYIDDRGFAKAWVEDRAERKGAGPLRLNRELTQRGIPPAMAREAIESAMDAERMEAIATAQAERRLARYQDLTTRDTYAKMYAFLQRRGFTADIIRRVLNRLIDNGFT